MPQAESIVLDCGIAYGRIASWLDDELCLARENDAWTFADHGWSCSIQLKRLGLQTLGHIELERTLLTAWGDSTALEAFQKLFTLRFMSAGG